MTLKLGRGCYDGVVRFGTILNNMTLKHKGVYTDYSGGFGTILNNMTLKPRRIIFSP
ncbi:conserved hypothetical protein [Enterococcus faecalis Merz96]|nr:conserved hypothetical protein [Enterococcus faecalis Merz96]HAP5148342.1 hypothetical protein [Enterococcus faecalis]HAP5600900.1 hypothetical protein [Enterococcus faecalis]